MRLILRCEKCGREYDAPTPRARGYNGHTLHLTFDEPVSGFEFCSKCNPPQLSYGPITEKMMTEALDTAWRVPGQDPLPIGARPHWWTEKQNRQARFVIRLLNHLHEVTPHLNGTMKPHPGADYFWGDVNFRELLLDLARER